jgi:CRP/FNR family transcriptional regulator, polysaccharide utilization system transcription regulator
MKKILIIEDNDDIRENLAEILDLAGFEAHTAENGKFGIEKAEKIIPDLILCDIMMPVLDGYGVLSIINKKPTLADIPFVFLTAKSEKTDFRYGMNLGADDYVTKPFETNELLSVIELRLAKSEKIKKAFDSNSNGNGNRDLNHFINEAKAVEALKTLTDNREIRHFAKKTEIYTEGSNPRNVYFIQKGKVKIYKTNEDGKELILNILGENDTSREHREDFFGHMAILSGGQYTESAMALEDCELIVLPKEDFQSLLNTSREVSAKFVKMLAGNLVSQEEHLLQLAYSSVRKRVANTLIVLHESYGNKPISMLREDIAALAGTAKETVIRTLTDFRTEKLIDVEDGRITVLKPEKLRSMMN